MGAWRTDVQTNWLGAHSLEKYLFKDTRQKVMLFHGKDTLKQACVAWCRVLCCGASSCPPALGHHEMALGLQPVKVWAPIAGPSRWLEPATTVPSSPGGSLSFAGSTHPGFSACSFRACGHVKTKRAGPAL